MKRCYLILILIFSLLLILSCGKLKGEFAFQNPGEKGYKINQSRFEFNSSESVNWIYKFDSTPGSRVELGVIILKKELGWIDILTTTDYIDSMKNIVYGTLKDYEPGDYKIVLVEPTSEGNKTIDEIEIYIYSDEEVLD
ncbi:MAG: hypothetical protein CVV49_11280 [Spirochaetae bacterium HGW-Spirochaetae-5]|nr:MAG: hypothetical protein CVV49_11280 [Spirochaetae bacterium HGW-Spirochaetae-5]